MSMDKQVSRSRSHRAPSPLAKRSTWWIALFSWYVRRFLRRHFHSVRAAAKTTLPALPPGPVIVAMNHPSWWDPLVAMLLASRFGNRRHLAPIDSGALERYRFFERLGLFGIEPGSAQGMRQLIRVANQAFRHPDVVLWITPQGAFSDVRQRPLALRPGVGMLAERLRQGTILPVAIEYPFWNERLPEVLVRFGQPIAVRDGRQRSARDWTKLIEERLTQTQDALREEAVARDPSAFETLLDGKSGISWIYDAWRRLRAWWRGETFQLEHGGLLR